MMNRFFSGRKKNDKKEQIQQNCNESLNDTDHSLLNQLVPSSPLIPSLNVDNNNSNNSKNGEIMDYIDDVTTVNYINRKKSAGTISTTGSNSKSNNFLSVDSCYAFQHKQNNLLSPNQTNEKINEKHRRPSIFDYMNEQDIDSETENQLLQSTKTPCSTVSNSSNDFGDTSTTTLNTNTTTEKSLIKNLNSNYNGIKKRPKNITYSISSDNFVRVKDVSLATSTSQIPLLQISFASDDQDGKYYVF
jgi:hypothetical protein